jgi:hypothetical protein
MVVNTGGRTTEIETVTVALLFPTATASRLAVTAVDMPAGAVYVTAWTVLIV